MTAATAPEPRLSRMLGRGLTRRCPWCGAWRSFVRRWLGKHERCRTCGIRWHREPGIEFGALMLNTLFTFAALAAAMTIGFVATSPDFAVLPIVASCIAIAIVVPLVVYPFTFTLWLAVDLAAHRPSAGELHDAAAHVKASPKV